MSSVASKRAARRLIVGFAGFAVGIMLAPGLAFACPYLDLLGDGANQRLANTSAIYASGRTSYPGAYVDWRYSWSWGWDYNGFVRVTYNVNQLKALEKQMDSEGYQYLNAFQNLNDNSALCLMQSYIVDAKAGSIPVEVNGAWIPCQVLKIAKDWLARGDTSRSGRVGEIMALADFIVVQEGMTKSTTVASWYWSSRHSFSAAGIRYFGTNPDFQIRWAKTVAEAWTYTCAFFVWCSLLDYSWAFWNDGPLDAMEVKSTHTATYSTMLHDAEAQLRLTTVAYSAYVPAAVIFDQTYQRINVYFELANYKSEFRFRG